MKAFGPACLRLCVGAVFFAHGAQKLFGVWGGGGIRGTAAYLASYGLVPAYPLAFLVGAVELAGGALLILGAWTFLASLALAIDMGVAIWRVHLPHGFFLNWRLVPGRGHGIEYDLVLLGALVGLMLMGPGAWSFDESRSQSREARARARARIRKV